MARRIVLDACAVIAYLNDEPGAEVIDALLQSDAALTIAAVNALEVAYDAVKVTGQSSAASDVLAAIEALPCTIEWTLSKALVEAAASFKARNRVSLADAIALGLAKSLDAELASGDHHEFDPIAARGEVRFIWIR